MNEPYMALIVAFAFNFTPYSSWLACNGALISIAQNTALFSLLGTYYGGDGMSTFAVPDLRGRIPIGMGQGQGLSNYNIGQMGGVESTALTMNQLPAHTHTTTHTLTAAPKASTGVATTNVPGSTVVPAKLPTLGAGLNTFNVNGYTTASPDATLVPGDVSGTITVMVTGGSQPVSIIQPYLAINYCIATAGTYPSRS
ncbi:tail fiber protein [Chitinophaga sancti]|uniref:phage tail protein n=1 Tax=Chitinophaga sancti TaxID=1004 RepID=UPI002A7578EB|nr:tail fiber protein [Chitinophaga sancti]WPQ62346.1 tail fiber protein [Chitinophaga sancti]